MIEAQAEKKQVLDCVRADAPLVDYVLCLLDDKDGASATFNVMETGSSIYNIAKTAMPRVANAA
jgi:hypothetical protein